MSTEMAIRHFASAPPKRLNLKNKNDSAKVKKMEEIKRIRKGTPQINML
jgi:hypothetical protein